MPNVQQWAVSVWCLVSQQEVAPPVMDVPSVSTANRTRLRPMLSAMLRIPASDQDKSFDYSPLVKEGMPIVDLAFGVVAKDALQCSTRACVIISTCILARPSSSNAIREADRATPCGRHQGKLFLLPRFLQSHVKIPEFNTVARVRSTNKALYSASPSIVMEEPSNFFFMKGGSLCTDLDI